MSYSKGVLIHNFNEDSFGMEMQGRRAEAQVPYVSVSHTVHHWKTGGQKDLPMGDPRQGLEGHLFFGHAGDMTTTENLKKAEYGTSSQYFLQDPGKLVKTGETLTADAFSLTDWHHHVPPTTSHIAAAHRGRWGDGRQCHALPPNEHFLTTNKAHFAGQQPEQADTTVRVCGPKGEFTAEHTKVKILRSMELKRGNSPLSSAGAALAGTAEGRAVAARAIKLVK